MPSVSVIIPAYNPGPLLRRSVESVLGQTFADLELIVVDDGGTEELDWVTEADPRVRLIRQSNRGVSVARNVGVEHAAGELVAFLDQDDEWLPTKLARQMALREERPDASFYYTRFCWTRGGAAEQASEQQDISYCGLLADQHVCLSSLLVERSTYQQVGGHDPLLVQMQDYDLFLRLAMLFGAPAGVAEPLVRYHLHDSNVSRDYLAAYDERDGLIRRHLGRAERRGDDAAVAACRRGLQRTRTLYGSQAYDNARAALRDRRASDLAVHLGRAMRWHPRYTARAASAWALGRR